MTKKLLNSFALAVCGVLLCLIAADINGKWVGAFDYNGNDVAVAADFKVDGDKLTGTITTPFGLSEIKEGKIDKDQLSYKINLNGEDIPSEGKVYSDSINVKFNYHGQDFLGTLKRPKN
ncbi:hypothetical protein HH214_02865 [Mucilaginibacter robiniae]|uniref:Glycoside hydrolase n=1 Tax=Mucilaginibacter robiniae TaxID=2728022 RepID=A0A7L5E035_9SPHI|nr:hypothetical protein [Mucilaginibacter robiniae]QJD94894.1 hypothetical protein HH214_02865 [Mucilaginibacter robiniae]